MKNMFFYIYFNIFFLHSICQSIYVYQIYLEYIPNSSHMNNTYSLLSLSKIGIYNEYHTYSRIYQENGKVLWGSSLDV